MKMYKGPITGNIYSEAELRQSALECYCYCGNGGILDFDEYFSNYITNFIKVNDN